jgi:hypothetical protein
MPIDLFNTSSTGAVRSPLMDQLAKRADVNGDGAVSKDEFSQFLGNLLDSLNGARNAASERATTLGRAIAPGQTGVHPSAGSQASLTPAAAHTLNASSPKAEMPSMAMMHGFNPDKWADTGHTTTKYTVGRILANHPPTPDGLKAALPEIQKAIPGVTLEGLDTLNIPGAGSIDVGLGFSTGGNVGWWWGPKE